MKWPEIALAACVFPLIVTAWAPTPPDLYVETQEVMTEEKWIPQHGAYASAYFDRFDTHGGTRLLRGLEFEVTNYIRFYHGIEVLDDAEYRWNAFGSSPDETCDCVDIEACDGAPGGTWVKGRLELLIGNPGETIVVDACTRYLGISVVGAPGPFDGVLDQDGPSGNYRWQRVSCGFETARITDRGVLAEFVGAGYESCHMNWQYGSVGRMDCPSDGAESFNVDSSYNHHAKALVTARYYYTTVR